MYIHTNKYIYIYIRPAGISIYPHTFFTPTAPPSIP